MYWMQSTQTLNKKSSHCEISFAVEAKVRDFRWDFNGSVKFKVKVEKKHKQGLFPV